MLTFFGSSLRGSDLSCHESVNLKSRFTGFEIPGCERAHVRTKRGQNQNREEDRGKGDFVTKERKTRAGVKATGSMQSMNTYR